MLCSNSSDTRKIQKFSEPQTLNETGLAGHVLDRFEQDDFKFPLYIHFVPR